MGDKLRETRLRWFGHVQRRSATKSMKRTFSMQVDGQPRKRFRLKGTWMEVVMIDLKKCNPSEDFGLGWFRIEK